ncbi:MAG: hypothetical protein ACYS47_20360 [Planctomycetota bacterium]|jgi:hypothetical protein
MTDATPYTAIPDPPGKITAGAVLARLLDGLGFRFRWATEGLREGDYAFKGCEETLSIGELTGHVWGLVNWVHLSLTGKEVERPAEPPRLRDSALRTIGALREIVLAMTEEQLANARIHDHPFWNFVNGPLADALTHTGQINVLRRLAGNPTPRANVFQGKPPDSR